MHFVNKSSIYHEHLQNQFISSHHITSHQIDSETFNFSISSLCLAILFDDFIVFLTICNIAN